MRIKHLLMAVIVAMAFLAISACGAAGTPENDAPEPASESLGVGTSVAPSDVESSIEEPLSSGLSVADVVENTLLSVVHIIAGSGTGTGFIISEDGLVVTNKHVVGDSSQVVVRFANGDVFGGNVTQRHPYLDLASIEIDAGSSFIPLAIGDSDSVRVGDEIIAVGFPLGWVLGLEPTVSVGIISAKRNNRLQTDASLNPGNSGGPLLNMSGQVVGVVVSRVETDDAGRPVSGIGFAIPINAAKEAAGGQVSSAGDVPQTPTPFPTTSPAPEVEATPIAEVPTPTPPPPTPTPTPSPPTPTPTPHPATFCQEWESLVLEWIKRGNYFWGGQWWVTGLRSTHDVPDHPQLPAVLALEHCATDFPTGILWKGSSAIVGYGENQLLPGTYEYRHEGYEGDNRVKNHDCLLRINRDEDNEESIEMPYGVPFTFPFLTSHGRVLYSGSYFVTDCGGSDDDSGLYRIGD